jgi:predicted YcjX-like family ATPase
LRLVLRFQSQQWFNSWRGTTQINLDIVDYPGEWLLDLPLLSLSYAEWSAEALERARRPHSAAEAAAFLAAVDATDPQKDANDVDAEALAAAFTATCAPAGRTPRRSPPCRPGRFLMPGDLEGSPALTFAPLPAPPATPSGRSLYAMLERRYEAYKDIVVRPFFRDHFARLDRQIVLVDTLRPLNAGPAAVADLEDALTDILSCFRQGDSNPLSRLVSRRIDRILFAATKADHIHSTSHDRLEAIMLRLVADATRRAKFAGAETRSLALAAIRATREGQIEEGRDKLDVIIGTPARRDPRRHDLRRQNRNRVVSRRFARRSGITLRRRPAAWPEVSPLPAAPNKLERDAGGCADAAPHPPRPRARLPDRRLAEMKRPVARTIATDTRPSAVIERRAPQAFAATDATSTATAVESWVEPEPDEIVAARPPRLLGFLGKIAWTAGGVLVSLALGLAADRLIRDLFAANEWLGWLGIAVLVVLLLALLALAIREILSLSRLRELDRLRKRAAATLVSDSRTDGAAIVGELLQVYASRARPRPPARSPQRGRCATSSTAPNMSALPNAR